MSSIYNSTMKRLKECEELIGEIESERRELYDELRDAKHERDEARALAELYRDRYWSVNSIEWCHGKTVKASTLPWEVDLT